MNKREKRVQRLLEILPGFVSWNLILFPYWGILVIPNAVAYFILIFNIYWFYQSLQIAITATISHFRIQASMKYDWISDVKGFPDYKKLRHVIIIVTYKEPKHTIERALVSLSKQNFPKDQMIVVLAQEKRAGEEHIKKTKSLQRKYKKEFGQLELTLHDLLPREAAGKASNERYAAIEIRKKYIDTKIIDPDYTIVTSFDADHVYHPHHLSVIAYKFLDNPDRYKHFWQGAVMFYNNIWKIPAVTRVPNTLMSIWNLSQMPRKDRLINAANYSLSFKLLHEVGYWDADKIPEDWGIFFKALYTVGGGIEVEPIYLPILVDAAESTSLFKTIRNQYEQVKRWAWGVSDVPWILKNYFSKKKVPFWDKTTRLVYMLWSHLLWPVNWFIITIGLTLPTLLNPAFGRTTLGHTVPRVSSFILTVALIFLVVMLIYDNIYKPKRPENIPFWRTLTFPLEFILMPIAGFFFSALPGLDAHTRLMLGKYIEYRVTEKV